MGSIFEDLSVLQIKQKTLNTIEHAFRKRYGDDPDDELLYRYHEEVSDLLQMDRLIDVAFLYDLVAELTDKYIPFYGAGAAGSSLVLNMLGITRCNPLPEHLYCPKCKELIWLKDDNTTIDGICPDCGTEMVSDGYNIPSESFTVDEGFYLIISTTEDVQYSERKKLSQFLEEVSSSLIIQCHRSYAVNLMHVRKLTPGWATMTTGITIPISSRYEDVFYDRFMQYHQGKGLIH